MRYSVRIRVTMSGSETETFDAASAEDARQAAEVYARNAIAEFAKDCEPEDRFEGSFVVEEVKPA